MVTGTRVRIAHVAVCPEVDPLLCAVQDIPEHWHDQRIAWFRLDPTLNVGLGGGWQASLSVPFDLRAVTVDYTLPDGTPFDPPYDDIHHREESIAGPIDAMLFGKRYVQAGERVLLGFGVGTTIPLGRTEEDPYALTEEGERHQHMQLGTGTFVPLATLEGVLEGPRWGGVAWLSGRLPLYESAKGYTPAVSLTGGFGPTFRVVPPVQLLVTAEGSWEGQERWGGVPYGGRATVLGGLGANWTISPRLVAQAQARVTALQWMGHHDPDEGSAVQRFLGTAGVSWTFGRSAEAAATNP